MRQAGNAQRAANAKSQASQGATEDSVVEVGTLAAVDGIKPTMMRKMRRCATARGARTSL